MSAEPHPSPARTAADRYHSFVAWDDEDSCYIGYCPDLFPYGGVCHGDDPVSTFAELRLIVEDVVGDLLADGQTLPPARIRPLAVEAAA